MKLNLLLVGFSLALVNAILDLLEALSSYLLLVLCLFHKLLLSLILFLSLSLLLINFLKLCLLGFDLLFNLTSFLLIVLNLHNGLLGSELDLFLLLGKFDLSFMDLIFLLLKLFGGLGLRELTLGKKLLLLLSLKLGSFLVFCVTRIFTFLECNPFDSLNLLLKVKSISLLDHPNFFILGRVADSPSLLHSADFPL